MIWGWLAFLLSPAVISWKEDKSANSTNIEVVFISSTAEPHWSDLQSWNLPRAIENDLWSLYKNSWSRACKHCHHRILNHWNVNINGITHVSHPPWISNCEFITTCDNHVTNLHYRWQLASRQLWCLRDWRSSNIDVWLTSRFPFCDSLACSRWQTSGSL